MDNYIVLYGLLVLVVFIKTSWIEYLLMSKNPSKYRKGFIDNTARRETVFEIIHKLYTHPKLINKNNKNSVSNNMYDIRQVIKEYLKDCEHNDENTKDRQSKGR